MISLNVTLFIQMINLLVLIWILNKMMYRPLRKILDERMAKVQGDLNKAKSLKSGAEENEKKYLHGLTEGRSDVRSELQTLRVETEAKISAMLSETQEKAKADFRDFAERIEKEMVGAREEIRAEAEAVAQTMADRLLGRGLS